LIILDFANIQNVKRKEEEGEGFFLMTNF